jgi:hypothetical protein
MNYTLLFVLSAVLASLSIFRNLPTADATNLQLPLIFPNTSFITGISRSVQSSFKAYVDLCSGHDEYLADGKCLDSFGFRSSLFESLETLFLLKLDSSFELAKTTIAGLAPQDFRWVNRREFWSRAIGSLIGTYLLTDDPLFLTTSVKFADSMLNITCGQPIPFINFAENRSDDSGTEYGIPLAEFATALPELSALYDITQFPRFKRAIEEIIDGFPPKTSGKYFDVYTKTGKRVSRTLLLNGRDIGFFLNVRLTDVLLLTNLTQTVLPRQLLPSPDPDAVLNIYPLLLVSPREGSVPFFDDYPTKVFFQEVVSHYLSDYRSPVNRDHFYKLNGFERSSIVPLALWRLQSLDPDGNLSQLVKEDLLGRLNPQGYDFYSGLKTTNNGRSIGDGILHSEFFGSLAKAAALWGSNLSVSQSGIVFNERGHILSLRK